MKITIDELFSTIEFENIVKEQWKKQYKETGKLQTRSKKSLIIELLKYYQSAEYVKGTKKTKASFELGDKLSIELSNAEMVEKGYRKANAGNTSNHNIVALKIFKNYLNQLKLKEVETISMTRIKWLKQAGITTMIADLNEVDKLEINKDFKKYYKDPNCKMKLATSGKKFSHKKTPQRCYAVIKQIPVIGALRCKKIIPQLITICH